MKTLQWVSSLALVASIGCFVSEYSWSQSSVGRADEDATAMKERIERLQPFSERLSEPIRTRLSGAALNLITLPERWGRMIARGKDKVPSASPRFREGRAPIQENRDRLLSPKKVLKGSVPASDPNSDVAFSGFAGFTQSETTTSWCGNTVLVGYNDSGSFIEAQFASPSGSLSFNGWALSTDGGRSFTDMGPLLSDPLPGGVNFRDLGGDPVIACSDPLTWYFASLATDFLSDSSAESGISVSKSTDGGETFGGAVMAVSKDAGAHFIDKEWMGVDPAHPDKIYVTYTDFDFSGASATCGSSDRTAIELVISPDGGLTWNAPVVVTEVCGSAFVQGSQVIVGPGGEVYVSWETFATDFVTREINIRKSTDMGASFEPIVKVANVVCVGDCSLLQGGFRSASEFPSLAVDRSGGTTNGNLYIVWNDARGRGAIITDFISGTYGFANILMSRSTDGGASWSAPVQVNDNVEPVPPGFGTDQYQPGVAVDRNGTVGVCWYDRRDDPNNFLIGRWCATSKNAGVKWKNKRMLKETWSAVPAQDFFLNPVYMGDYDTLASDFTLSRRGFISAWGDNRLGNPDAVTLKFQ